MTLYEFNIKYKLAITKAYGRRTFVATGNNSAGHGTNGIKHATGSNSARREGNRGNSQYRSGKREGNDSGRGGGPKNKYNPNRQRSEGRSPFKRDGDDRPPKKNFGGKRSTYDKDRNEDNRRDNNRQKSSQNRESKVKEQQPDKMEIINRIEKEKKAIQKKKSERKNTNRGSRQQSRPKRMGNVDWTRAYENDSYDDDDFDAYL